MEACSNYWKKIIDFDDYYYIQSIDYSIKNGLFEIDKVKLAKFIKVDRETNAYT